MPESTTTYQSIPSEERQTIDRLAIGIERAYGNVGRLVWRSFLQGFMSALGAAAGTLCVLILSVVLFKQLGGPAFIQNLVAQLSESIAQAQVHTFLGK